MSALTYRVSSILFRSGVSYQDMTRLNRLGIGMSPDMVVSFQRQLGKNFDSKVLSYKSSLEEKPHDTLALMMEIKDKQPVTNDDIVAIDVCEEKLSSYQHFTPVCFTLITEIKNDCFLLNTINLDQSPSPQSGAFPFACPLPLPSVFSLLQELQDWSL